MNEPGRTAGFQRELAAHLRDPAGNPPPPAAGERGLAVYRELVFNNVAGLLATFFPVTRSLHDDVAWQALVRDFLARHHCTTPYFLEIAEEFLAFLAQERADHPADPPFLRELVHYEWLELVLDVAVEEFPMAGVDAAGDLLAGIPVLSPLVVLAAYRWPVHRIHAGVRPEVPGTEPLFLMVYRDRAERVRFMEVNAAAARLFTLLREQPAWRGTEIVCALAQEFGHAGAGDLAAAVREVLAGWQARDIVAGCRA